MAGFEYVPKFLCAGEISFVAAANVVAGQLVQVTADYQVSPSSAPGQEQFGVAAMTVASGGSLSVYFEGVHTLSASGAIPAGAAVVAGAAGAVAAATASTPAGEVVGYALNTATNGQVDVRLSY